MSAAPASAKVLMLTIIGYCKKCNAPKILNATTSISAMKVCTCDQKKANG